MSLARKSHRKTRTGCANCKKRKIKCDEHRPSCHNCVRHDVSCDFNHDPPALALEPSLTSLDLELMHNYSVSTSATLNPDPVLRQFWRVTVPRLAFGCDFIMRSVLSVSALHLATCDASREPQFTATGLRYHRLAARQAMALMASDAVKASADKLFLFSALTIYIALASPRQGHGVLLLGEACPDWLPLIKGTRSLLSYFDEEMYTGALSPLFKHGSDRWKLSQGSNSGVVENSILSTLEDYLTCMERSVIEDRLKALYRRSGSRLAAILAQVHSQPAAKLGITDAFVWVWEGVDDFLPLLEEPTQEAVVIFCYFCVLLQRIEPQWWIQGWPRHLVARAHGILDEEHRLWIQPVMEDIGWVPGYERPG